MARGEEEEVGGLIPSPAAQAVALVVDSELTSYLMMGALSPLLKRHAVSLSREAVSPALRCTLAPAVLSLMLIQCTTGVSFQSSPETMHTISADLDTHVNIRAGAAPLWQGHEEKRLENS